MILNIAIVGVVAALLCGKAIAQEYTRDGCAMHASKSSRKHATAVGRVFS